MWLRVQRSILRTMNKLTAGLLAAAVACVLALPAGAMAAKPVKYVGKTDAGHKVTFQLVGNKKITHFVTGVRTQCLSIQGGGAPLLGIDPWPDTWVLLNRTAKFELMRTPAFYWHDVTNNYEISNKKHRNGTITGKLRNVYEFLVPKYPIGTFVIYSCLSENTFRAKPAFR
jgi:hypothetical protein